MALQSENLVMVGLGIHADAPPLVEQPKLVDGVHLRWSIARERGFPWHGFFLYRRPSEQREVTDCNERLRRLYRSIEDGIVELDDILRERTATLKSERERAKAALDRARAQCGTVTRSIQPRSMRLHD